MHSADLKPAAEVFVKELLNLSKTSANGHLSDTPRRIAGMYAELLTPEEFEFTTFKNEQGYDQIVLADGIRFYSLCAHHLLPFFGVASVAYIPGTHYIGLSKLARVVKYYSRRLQVQEDLTQQIGDFLDDRLHPVGAAVIIKGRHLCMEMRGVESPGAVTTTSYLKGAFRDNPVARAELFGLLRKDEAL
jgi:GTP cyclohydrolase I